MGRAFGQDGAHFSTRGGGRHGIAIGGEIVADHVAYLHLIIDHNNMNIPHAGDSSPRAIFVFPSNMIGRMAGYAIKNENGATAFFAGEPWRLVARENAVGNYMTMTVAPIFTWAYSSVTSAFSMRTQPEEADLPIEAGSLVPWMR